MSDTILTGVVMILIVAAILLSVRLKPKVRDVDTHAFLKELGGREIDVGEFLKRVKDERK